MLNPFQAMAREDPPGPDPLQFIFGGRKYFKQLGITVVMTYILPADIDPNQKGRIYNFDNDVELYRGTQTIWDIYVHNGRKENSSETVMHISDGQKSQQVEIARFCGSYARIKYVIPETFEYSTFVTFYSDAGRKDQDNFSGIPLFINPKKPNGTTTYQQNNQQFNNQVSTNDSNQGKVTVCLWDDKDRLCQSILPLKIAIYADGKRYPRIKNDFYIIKDGKCTIDSIASGTIELKLPPGEANKWLMQSKTRTFSLEPGQELIINFIRSGGINQ
jgi:hypothetical protein